MFKSLLSKFVLLTGVMIPGLALADSLKPEEIYQKLLPSVMTLQVENFKGEKYVATAFLARGDGVAVTSWHVISDAASVQAKLSDGRVVEVRGLVDKDEQHDLALIQVGSLDRPQASLSITKPPIGSRAYAIGAPKGFEFSITDGLISQIQQVDGYEQFQVSCAISGGNSGGPIVNERGEVVGVTSWTKRDAQNLSFATPARFLQALNPKLPVVTWDRISGFPTPAKRVEAADAVRSSGPDTSMADLKRVLKDSAGKKVTIVVVKEQEEKKFEVIVPKDFVK